MRLLAARYRAAFGGDYICPSPHSAALGRLVAARCGQHGLLHRMSHIVADYKRWPQGGQLSMF